MKYLLQSFALTILAMICISESFAQKKEMVKVVKSTKENKIDIFIGDKLFTSFLYPDSLEKPVLYPVHAANGTIVTRGFPLDTQPNDPTDHPHHIGIWFTFENVNGLDFWNNSYAIPKEKNIYTDGSKRIRFLKHPVAQKGYFLIMPTGPISKTRCCWKKLPVWNLAAQLISAS